MVARHSSPPSHGHGRTSHDRPAANSHTAMPIGRKAAVYLLSSARPVNTPTASHHAGRRPVTTWARAHNAQTQKNSSGVSGVSVVAPAPSIRVAFSKAAAHDPA